MDFFVNSATDPAFNLALEEVLASECSGAFFMLWRNDRAVIVGRNQHTQCEIDAEYVRSHRVAVVRRITGGGAVYHDLGNVNYTLAVPGRHGETPAFQKFAQPVVSALRQLQVEAEFSGRNDILVRGRKVSGSARTLLTDRTLFHGTLLFDADLTALAAALRPDPEKIRSKGIASVRSRVANLKEFLLQFSTAEFMAAFGDALCRELNVPGPSPLPAGCIARAQALADAKYRTREWNYHSPIAFTFTKHQRFAAGGVQLQAQVKDGRILAARITGDFFGSVPVAELEQRLVGCEFAPQAVMEYLTEAELAGFISGVTLAEFAGLFE